MLKFFMFQKIKDFFSSSSPKESKSLKDLMSSVGYNREMLNNLSHDDFKKNLAEKVTGVNLENKRVILEQNHKEAWMAFQIANAQKIRNICFVNFFPKNLKGLFLKTHKNKKGIIELKTFEEAKDLQECVFVSSTEFNLENAVHVGEIGSSKQYSFFFNGNLSEIQKVEKAILSENVIGFSASTSIFDGSRFGFKKIFSERKAPKIKKHAPINEEEIKSAFFDGRVNFIHIQNLFEAYDNMPIASMSKLIPGLNANLKQMDEFFKEVKCMIRSMSNKEKKNPMILNTNSRVERISAGSGQSIEKTRKFIMSMISLLQRLKSPENRKKILESGNPMAMMSQLMGQIKK
jgi:hypothetical protein